MLLLTSTNITIYSFYVELGFDLKPQEDGGVLLRQDICNHPKGLKQFRRGNVYHVGDRVVSDCTVKRRSQKVYDTIFVAKKFEFTAEELPAEDPDNWLEMPKRSIMVGRGFQWRAWA